MGYYLGTKFLVKSGVGDGCIPIFRAAEMIYNEAEAQCRLGNEQAVRELREEATIPYQPDYTCTKSGGNYGPADRNNWTLVIPTMETNYNNKVISQEDPN